jgi:hypothetical protein
MSRRRFFGTDADQYNLPRMLQILPASASSAAATTAGETATAAAEG